MFGSKPKLRRDLPPIDIRKKQVKGLFGPKMVAASKREQRAMKAELMKTYPDRYFVDDLNERNSISGEYYDMDWLDRLECYDEIMDEDW